MFTPRCHENELFWAVSESERKYFLHKTVDYLEQLVHDFWKDMLLSIFSNVFLLAL